MATTTVSYLDWMLDRSVPLGTPRHPIVVVRRTITEEVVGGPFGSVEAARAWIEGQG